MGTTAKLKNYSFLTTHSKMWELLHFLTSYNKSFITQETVSVGTTAKLKNYSFLTTHSKMWELLHFLTSLQ
ncbi:hypothetical protein LEP1GSC041_1834 [Leptospira noguchii str. 2006001870]|nr:hypothetical protein LEP1GSC041_1834 [Leptospira noguchii str. 2006001870]